MEISTETDNQSERKKKCCNQWKLHSEKNGLKISKPYLQHFMQNSILEHVEVAKLGADYKEQAAQVKRQPV